MPICCLIAFKYFTGYFYTNKNILLHVHCKATVKMRKSTWMDAAAAAAAKSLQSCPTLCDPIDGSPPGSPIPGILQARTLEWVDG